MNEEPIFEVHVVKADGHVVSERTAAALEELIIAAGEEQPGDAEDEVSGFGMMIGGGMRPRISAPGPLQLCIPIFYYSDDSSDDGSGGGTADTDGACIGIYA